jgi:hypothetical protein
MVDNLGSVVQKMIFTIIILALRLSWRYKYQLDLTEGDNAKIDLTPS